MRKNEEEQGGLLLYYGKSILLGGVTAFFLCTVFLFLAAVGISRGILDTALQYRVTVVICVFSSFLGSLLVIRQCRERGIMLGIAIGAVLFLLQLSAGILIYDTFSLEHGGIGLLCGGVCGGAAAGILSGGGRSRPRKKTGKRRR